MKDTKAIKLLQSLSQEEFVRLGKFLRSPFFNYATTMVQLYDHLRKYYPAFDTKKLDKEKVWTKLFPDKAFNDNKYWNLCFQFGKLLEKFLAVVQLEAKPSEERKLLIQALGERNVYDLFQKETSHLLKNISSQPYRDADYFADKAKLEMDLFFHPMTPKLTLQDSTLTDLMDSIDNHFVLMKLRVGSEMKNRERTLSKKYEMKWMDAVMLEAMSGSLSENAPAKIYRSVNALYGLTEGHAAYFQLKGLLRQNIHKLRKEDQSLVSVQLINYAVRQINSGHGEFYKEAFEINKIRLEDGLLVENNRISEAGFGNVVTLGCQAKEYTWVWDFIREYQQYLNDDIRENVVSLNTGLWYFYQNKFDEAYKFFSEFSYSHFYQPRARVNLIRTLFEQFLQDNSLYGLLAANLESFEKFIYRSEVLTADNKKNYVNFAFLLKKIVRGKLSGTKREVMNERLLTELKRKKNIIGKDWLMKKIET